jgi:hypothetical protein
MDYCGPRGLPRSRFLGWRQDDQDAALLWVIRTRQRCGECGTHPDDWDPEVGGHGRAHVAHEYTCRGCAALDNRRPGYEKRRDKGDSPGLRLGLRPNAPQPGEPQPDEPEDAPP